MGEFLARQIRQVEIAQQHVGSVVFELPERFSAVAHALDVVLCEHDPQEASQRLIVFHHQQTHLKNLPRRIAAPTAHDEKWEATRCAAPGPGEEIS